MSVPYDPFASPLQRSTSLASAALPRRVREVLEDLYALLADELARQLERMLVDYEQQLFRLATRPATRACRDCISKRCGWCVRTGPTWCRVS